MEENKTLSSAYGYQSLSVWMARSQDDGSGEEL